MIITTQSNDSIKRLFKCTLIISCLVFVGCSSSSKAPTEDITSQPPQSNDDLLSPGTDENDTALGNAQGEQDDSIQSSPLFDNADPFKQELPFSNNEILSSPGQSPLENVKALVQQRQYAQAQALTARIDKSRLSLQDQASLSLAESQIFSASNQNELALASLNAIQPSLLPLEESSQFFWLKARTQYQLGDTRGALESLADRENYISSEEIPANQTMMMSIINSLSPEEIQALSQNTLNSSLLYWLVSNQIISQSENQLDSFNSEYFNSAQNSASIDSNWQFNSAKQIAVLLPFSSNFAAAAKEFEKGFNQAHQNNSSSYKPQIRFYDVGASDIPAKLSLAIQNGADFIIGPLGKKAAEVALNFNLPIPMMTIGGRINPVNSANSVNSLSPNKFTFSLTPEAEGAAIAHHARSQDLQNAVIFTPNSFQTSRLSNAFQQTWQSLGGSVQTYEFTPEEYDHSATVKLALGIYNSEQRHNELSSILGSQPKFIASRKGNVDMILLDSSYSDAKNLKPQLNFFDANAVATYGPSSLNPLTAPIGEKADLDGLIVPEMPALILTKQEAGDSQQPNLPVSFSRLSALGFDSYELIPILNQLRNQQISYLGKTGQLVLDNFNNTSRLPSWAKFTSGELQLLEP